MLFGDVVGFTNLASKVTATELVVMLDTIFFEFDSILEEYGLEKIKTIGDCYVVCAGTFLSLWFCFRLVNVELTIKPS